MNSVCRSNRYSDDRDVGQRHSWESSWTMVAAMLPVLSKFTNGLSKNGSHKKDLHAISAPNGEWKLRPVL